MEFKHMYIAITNDIVNDGNIQESNIIKIEIIKHSRQVIQT